MEQWKGERKKIAVAVDIKERAKEGENGEGREPHHRYHVSEAQSEHEEKEKRYGREDDERTITRTHSAHTHTLYDI